MGRMTEEEIIMKAIQDSCPSEEECLADEEECFRKHPVHEAGSTSGVVVSVYADVDGLASIVVSALREAGRIF